MIKENRTLIGASIDNFYSKTWVGLCHKIGKRLFVEVSFYSLPKEYRLISRTKWYQVVLGIFKTAFLLSDRHIFVRQSKEIWSDFIKLTVKQVFWKTEIESTTMENATFPYKTSLSKANVMTNRMGSIE